MFTAPLFALHGDHWTLVGDGEMDHLVVVLQLLRHPVAVLARWLFGWLEHEILSAGFLAGRALLGIFMSHSLYGTSRAHKGSSGRAFCMTLSTLPTFLRGGSFL
jgi:hypothetical protein